MSLAHTYYNMVQALGLHRLHDMIQGAATIECSSSPVWLLGVCYHTGQGEADSSNQEQSLQELMLDFSSRVWMTYRKGFEPLGATSVSSDVGWGCMLRSGQMLMAQALVHHRLGREWRQPAKPSPDDELSQLLRLFWDAPDAAAHPLSIHSLCQLGSACGVGIGEWLGPSPLCKTLEALANKHHPHLGLRVHVVADPGGGAPQLYSGGAAELFPSGKAAGSGEAGGSAAQAAGRQAQVGSGLVLLVPLVLGLDKVNPAYLPQIQSVLAFPQSLGVVGGRPGSSLYLIGYQGDQLIYLDPHTVQEAVVSQALHDTYHCKSVRTMPAHNIDPSVALGFYCRNAGEFADLCQRLRQLEGCAGGCPLVCVREAPLPQWGASGHEVEVLSEEEEQPSAQVDGWELL